MAEPEFWIASGCGLIGSASKNLSHIVGLSKKHKDDLLSVSFTSLSSYLWLLRLVSQVLSGVSDRTPCMLYLAAAVSDFYVPTQELPVHKIQSSQVISVFH